MTNSKLTKSLKYSVVTQIVNFNPEKFHPKTIIVSGNLAIRLAQGIYKKM